jgi:hypothetical protein
MARCQVRSRINKRLNPTGAIIARRARACSEARSAKRRNCEPRRIRTDRVECRQYIMRVITGFGILSQLSGPLTEQPVAEAKA